MPIQNGYSQMVEYIKIDAKVDHDNYGTSQFGDGRKVSFTVGNTTIKAQQYNIFNNCENRVRDIFGTTEFRYNDQLAVISGQHIFKGFVNQDRIKITYNTLGIQLVHFGDTATWVRP